MFILKKGHQPGVYMPLRALFLVVFVAIKIKFKILNQIHCYFLLKNMIFFQQNVI